MLQTALLGTERHPLTPPTADSPLWQIWHQRDAHQPERTLLQLAGAQTLYDHAGQMATPYVRPLPPPTAAEAWPPCSAEASRLLAAMLHTPHQEVLEEFLELLYQTRQRLPEEHLPLLLNRGRRMANLRQRLLPVMGNHGRWLAQQNPQWHYAAIGPQDEETMRQEWLAGDKNSRYSLLQQLRHQDPAQARQLLRQSWKNENPTDRFQYIRLLEINLSMEDEPFLEQVLDDRNLHVRRKAAELLASLPTSRLCQRMAERLRAHVGWHPFSRTLGLTLPSQTTPAMMRDGIHNEGLRGGLGEESWRLAQMISATPLSYWGTETAAAVELLISTMSRSKWSRALLRGVATAAERQRNATWAWVLLNQITFTTTTERNLINLVRQLPPAQRETLALAQLHTQENDLDKLQTAHPFMAIVGQCQHDWSETLSHAFLRRLRQHIKQDKRQTADAALNKLILECARRLPPHWHDEVAHQLVPLTHGQPAWETLVATLLATLHLRAEMREKLTMSNEQRAMNK